MVKLLIASLTLLSYFAHAMIPAFCPDEIKKIGQRIYQNECGSKPGNLVYWKSGEQNLSLGIGHFIWYPKTVPIEKQYIQQFPALVKFLQQKNIAVPAWLKNRQDCPWSTQDEWLKAKDSNHMQELQHFLETTINEQAEFIVNYFMEKSKKLLEKQEIQAQFNCMLKTSAGIYALLDYANFKGFGLDERERYNHQGWGLFQVLRTMNVGEQSDNCVESFVTNAKKILELRVQNAPAGRNEKQWLQGWYNRLDTYLR